MDPEQPFQVLELFIRQPLLLVAAVVVFAVGALLSTRTKHETLGGCLMFVSLLPTAAAAIALLVVGLTVAGASTYLGGFGLIAVAAMCAVGIAIWRKRKGSRP